MLCLMSPKGRNRLLNKTYMILTLLFGSLVVFALCSGEGNRNPNDFH